MVDFTPKVAFLVIILGILSRVSADPRFNGEGRERNVGLIQGYIASVFMSVNDEGKPDLTVIPTYAKYIQQNGLDGVLVSGTAGECNKFSVEERKSYLEAWVKAARSQNLKVICQVGASSIVDAKELARYAEYLRINAIMTVPELYYKPTTVAQLVYFMRCIASAAPNTSLFYYHAPYYTEVNLDMLQFWKDATSQIPTFKGIKTEEFSVALQLRTKVKPDQRIFIANSTDIAPAAAMGFTDYILTSLNLLPSLVKEIVRDFQSCQLVKGRANYEKLRDILKTIASQGRDEIPAQKESFILITGINVGPIRDPQTLSETQKQELEAALRNKGIKLRGSAQD